MSICYIGLRCTCNECGAKEEFDNPKEYDSWTLQSKAINRGWYLPGNGKQRCPKCHMLLSRAAGVPSMYTTHPNAKAIAAVLEKLKALEEASTPTQSQLN